MVTGRGCVLVALLAYALLSAWPARAAPLLISSGSVDTSTGTLVDNGTTSSSVLVDANNFAQSFVTPAAGVMGARVGTSISGAGESFTQSEHDDDWGCGATPPAICASITVPLLPVKFNLGLDGVVSGADFLMDAHYTTSFGDRFNFQFDDDGASASFNGTAVPVLLTTDASGNVHFSLDVSLTVLEPIVPGPLPPGSFVFADTQFIEAMVFGNGTTHFVDALHTFNVSVTSLDPSFPLVSTDGRSGSLPSSSVPEPTTLALLGLAFGGMGLARRRKLN